MKWTFSLTFPPVSKKLVLNREKVQLFHLSRLETYSLSLFRLFELPHDVLMIARQMVKKFGQRNHAAVETSFQELEQRDNSQVERTSFFLTDFAYLAVFLGS